MPKMWGYVRIAAIGQMHKLGESVESATPYIRKNFLVPACISQNLLLDAYWFEYWFEYPSVATCAGVCSGFSIRKRRYAVEVSALRDSCFRSIFAY